MVKIILGDVNFLINQSEINFTKKNTPKIYKLINGEQTIQTSCEELQIIEFSGYFESIEDYNEISDMIKSGNSQNLIVSGLNIPINMYAIIENFNAWESGGDIDRISYSIKLREYISKTITKITESDDIFASNDNIGDKTTEISTPTSYTVQWGDTLYGLARRFLFDGNRYNEIATLNNIKNPNLIYAGQVILIP